MNIRIFTKKTQHFLITTMYGIMIYIDDFDEFLENYEISRLWIIIIILLYKVELYIVAILEL